MDNRARGIEFEAKCRTTLQQLGFDKIEATKSSKDQGADLIATLGPTKYVFQCKNEKRKQGNGAVQEAIAARSLYGASRCAVISQSEFCPSAYVLARPNYCLLLTFQTLSLAAEQGKTFNQLIQGYKFPDIPFVEHDPDLIKRYEDAKHRLGHTPRNSDFDPTTRHLIAHKYGGVTNLAKQLGDKPYSRKPNKDEIRREYRRVRELMVETPTLEDMTANSKLPRNCFKDYPFTKLQREFGDRPNYESGVTKDTLIEAFNRLQSHLGHTPRLHELDEKGEYRSSYYRARWGNIDNFLRELRIPRGQVKRRAYKNNELVLMYFLLEKAFGIKEGDGNLQLSPTILKNLKYEGRAFISASTFSKRFGGSWERFIEYIRADSASGIKSGLEQFVNARAAKQADPPAGDQPMVGADPDPT